MQDPQQPPQLAPDAKIFEELYCTNVHASSIRSEDRTYLLCDTEYDDSSLDESCTSEHPVQVHFGECHHVFVIVAFASWLAVKTRGIISARYAGRSGLAPSRMLYLYAQIVSSSISDRGSQYTLPGQNAVEGWRPR
jgi:hypothetical protein